jgi:hypothetical protein
MKKQAEQKEPLADLIFRSGPGPGIGLLQGVACTTLKRSEMLRKVNAQHPSGTTAGWQVSTKRVEGKRNPFPCLDAPGRRHYLLEC